MRKVKCAITKEEGTSDTFYKAPNGKYYKTKEIYENYIEEQRYQTMCKDLLLNLLGYSKGEPFPTLLTKKIKEFSYYGFNTLYETISDCKSKISWAMDNKNFNSEYNKISYAFAIISRNIKDVNKKVLQRQKYIKMNSKIDDIIPEPETIISAPTTKNISNWLGDDD